MEICFMQSADIKQAAHQMIDPLEYLTWVDLMG